MKNTHIRNFSALAACAAIGGCSSEIAGPTEPELESPGSFAIEVAPFEIDSRAAYACYGIEVTDTNGDEVWSDASICTNTWSISNEGTLSYVGLCEASGDGLNNVTISLERLVADDGTELGNWAEENPPTYTAEFLCTANADTVVRANFLVITEGTKGFLDVSVSVQEIACNAKVDCHSDFLGDDPAEGDPHMRTIVVALACDAVGDDFTQIMIDEVVLTCTDELGAEVVVSVDPSTGVGALAGYPSSFVAGAVGNVGISADGTSFITLALAIESGWTDCSLATRMAANDGRNMDENDQFPVIIATDIPFGFDTAGVFSCEVNPLDGDASGLYTAWGTSGNLDFHACLNEDASISLCD